MLFILATGCTPAGGNSGNLKPEASTNQAAQTNLNLGIEYLRRQEYEKSLEKLNRSLEYDPYHHATHNVFGLLYQRLGKPEQAERSFRRALDLSPADSATNNNYGQFLCSQDRFAEAEEHFLQAAANPLYETPEIPISNAGTCALRSGDAIAAEKHLRRALQLNPRIPSALLQMARLSYEQDNFLSARGYLQRYLEIARHTPQSLWLGIRIERQLGDKDALSSYRLSLKNNFPDSEEAKQLSVSEGSR